MTEQHDTQDQGQAAVVLGCFGFLLMLACTGACAGVPALLGYLWGVQGG